MPEVSINDATIHYTVELKKNKKHVTIYVTAEKGVKVTAPKLMKEDQIKLIVVEKADWILKKLEEMAERSQKVTPRLFKEGETLLFLGKAYPLKLDYISTCKKPILQRGDDHFVMTLPPSFKAEENMAALLELCTNWYKIAGKEIIEERVRHFSSIIDLSPSKITVKEQKKRWGTCTSKGHLHFNWKLAMAPLDVIDYVVIHELAHLKHFNHSPKFWGYVKSIMPNFNEKKEWLRHNGILLKL